jgi:hypothetical protein
MGKFTGDSFGETTERLKKPMASALGLYMDQP